VRTLTLFLSLAVFMLLIGGARGSSTAIASSQQADIVSALGVAKVQGKDVLVHVSVLVAPGANASEQAEAALQEQGARPFQPSDYVLLGPTWSDDPLAGHPVVEQYYNSSGAPAGSFLTEMQSAESVWTNVAGSDLVMTNVGLSTRCGSLIKECPGAQVFDDFQDVGWNDLGHCSIARCTLAVTWFGDADGDGTMDDADVAFNTRVSPWSDDCTNDYSFQTVAIHEFGHVNGLGHSDVDGAIMQAYYGGASCALGQDDIDGLIALYPAGGGSESPTLLSISVAPTDATIDVGHMQQFTATGHYDGSSDQDLTDLVTWNSSNPDIASIDASGLATGVSVGDSTISAALDGVSSNDATLTVQSAPPPGAGPTVRLCDPDTGTRGQQEIVTVMGTGFADSASVSFGQRVMVQNVTVVSDTEIMVQIKVHPRADYGLRDVVVTNPDGQSSTGGGDCFEVVP
jgi:hypothetical protein